MTALHPRVEAELAVAPGSNVAARTVVAIQPSDADPIWDEMRIALPLDGRLISRAFDPGEPIATGAPIAYVTKSGATYVTKSGNRYVKKVQP